ncbi:MAG: glycine--tRNA ligase subunit beta [Thermaerobacter sp.]|nr:glycine--tRNA ligase subunit beta [Thermaerobacter sp.]
MTKSDYRTFVIEVGVEEIPSRFLDSMGQEFGQAMQRALTAARLAFHGHAVWYTPRRLIFQADVAAFQTAETETVRGPAVLVAFDDGRPTPALKGFLGRVGMRVEDLGRQMVGDREYVIASIAKPTASAADVLPDLVTRVLTALPQPRSMRWNGGDARFIRPVRWLLLVLDDALLKAKAMGISSGNVTYGNRTDHPDPIPVKSVKDYWEALSEGRVEADMMRRRDVIMRTCTALAQDSGGEAELNPDLLAEVANLVEWPTPFLGTFEPEFLQIPEPILVTAMRVHQRYFPVRAQDGRLRPNFLAVRNGVGEALDEVRRGNQKVLRARLADARYFFELDRRGHLADHRQQLNTVTLHAKLGTYEDKLHRVKALFSATRQWWPLNENGAELFDRSVDLYKCDLLTHVVGEFPELQGEMGGIYAALDGEDPAVVAAVRDQYRPASGTDTLPSSGVAQVLGLLDRVDTLMAFYHANIRASGSQDPYGLRRAALGAARIAAETPILPDHSLIELLQAHQGIIGADPSVTQDVDQLIRTRLESQLERVWPADVILAVLTLEFPWIHLSERLRFFASRRAQAEDVMTAYKRVSRIVQGAHASPPGHLSGVEQDLFRAAERAAAVPDQDLENWWQAAGELALVVNRFFDEVLVMDPDPDVRARRLGLLAKAKAALGRYIDWDRLRGGSDG